MRGNPILTSWTGFEQLRRVERDFEVGGGNASDGNAMLGSVPGFGALEIVGGHLLVRQNAALTTISGFESLESIGRTPWYNK